MRSLRETNRIAVIRIKERLGEALTMKFPTSSTQLTQDDVVKMLYMASGWVGSILKDKATERKLEAIALDVHDSDVDLRQKGEGLGESAGQWKGLTQEELIIALENVSGMVSEMKNYIDDRRMSDGQKIKSLERIINKAIQELK